jgi:tetratricopeptide (TPR) repeat protein
MISELMTQFLVCDHFRCKISITSFNKISSMYRRLTYWRTAPNAVSGFLLAIALFLQPLYAAETPSTESLLAAAKIALDKHDYKGAAEAYQKAALQSDDVEVALEATRVCYSYGFNAEALVTAERWVKLDGDSDEALLYVAQLQLRQGDIRKSYRNFRKLLERGDEPFDQRLVSLIPLLSQEDAAAADQLMRKLAKPYRDSAYAHYAVAVMALQAEDADEAGKRAQRAIELDPEWLQPKLVYARSLLMAGDTDAAIDYTARIVGDDPDPDPDARLELAIMLLSAGRDDDALSQISQVMLEQPDRPDALRLMAIINFRLENLDVAQADFEELLASGRYTMDALYYLARIADFRGDRGRAIALYSQVIHGPNAVLSQRRAGYLISEDGDADAAIRHLQKFGETHPNYAVDMILAQAQLMVSLKRYEDALGQYDRVISYGGDDREEVTLGKAELLLRMGRQDDALKLYREAVHRWPDSSLSLNALGYTLADRTDRYAEAAKLIRKALDLDPDSAAIMDSYGWVLFRQGRYDEALTELQRAYELLKDPEVASHLVDVLNKLGRHDDARQLLQDAELLFPENELLAATRERIFPEK